MFMGRKINKTGTDSSKNHFVEITYVPGDEKFTKPGQIQNEDIFSSLTTT